MLAVAQHKTRPLKSQPHTLTDLENGATENFLSNYMGAQCASMPPIAD